MFGLVKEMNESGWAHHNLHDFLCQQILILPPARSQYVWLRRRSLIKTAITSRRKLTAHSATMIWISLLEWSLRSAQRAWTTGMLRWGPGLAVSTHIFCVQKPAIWLCNEIWQKQPGRDQQRRPEWLDAGIKKVLEAQQEEASWLLH